VRPRPDRDPSSKRARWIALLLATVATWLPIGGLFRLAATPAPGLLDRADFVAASGGGIPADEAPWRPVALPDDWRDRRPGVSEGWYRLRFDFRKTADERWAVYVPFVMMNAAVWVNRERVGDGGRFDEPVSRNWNRPLSLPLPADALRPGRNTLHVFVAADLPDAGLLPALNVGRLHDLEPAYDRAQFIRRTLVAILVVFRLVVAAGTPAVRGMWR
jgi:hypothetical protein